MVLSLKVNWYEESSKLCEDVNKHPYWQIQQICSNDYKWFLFYKTEDCDEDEASEETNAKNKLPVVENTKDFVDAINKTVPTDEERSKWHSFDSSKWRRQLALKEAEEEVKKAEDLPPEESTSKVLSEREIDDLLCSNSDGNHKYVISVYEDSKDYQKTFFLRNMKFDDNGKLYEYDFCYNVNDADKFGLYKTAVDIKNEVESSYKSTAYLNVQTRQVNILDIADEED